jgi:hypothetical protein
MTETWKAILATLFVTAMTIWFVVSLRRHHRATLEAACRWRERSPMGDAEFVKACEIPDEPLMAMVALAARRVIAELGTVPPETIRPDDSFAHDLVQLPYWDSLDWLDFIFQVERECRSRIPRLVFDEVVRSVEGRPADLRVRHVVRAVTMAATAGPTGMTLDHGLV